MAVSPLKAPSSLPVNSADSQWGKPPSYTEISSRKHLEAKPLVGEIIRDVILAPISLIVGIVQSAIFLLILFVKGITYKTGIKGYFIDQWVLQQTVCTKDIQNSVRNKINSLENGIIGRQLTIFDENKNRIEAVVIEKEDSKAAKTQRATAARKAIAPKERKWVIYDTGVMSNYQVSMNKIIHIYNAFDANIICANSAGVGTSTGHAITSDELVMPTESILRHLINTLGVDKNNITVMGHSLGGAKSARIAAKSEFSGINLILDRSFNTFSHAAKGFKLAAFPFNFLLAGLVRWALPFETTKAIPFVKGNVTAVCAPQDPVITFNNSAVHIQDPNIKKIFVRFNLEGSHLENGSFPQKYPAQHTLSHTPEVLKYIWEVHNGISP
jgi:hypothetical protein